MVFVFDDEVWYSAVEDLYEALAAEPELDNLMAVAAEAAANYDPRREAVVLENGHDGICVRLARAPGFVTLGVQAYMSPS